MNQVNIAKLITLLLLVAATSATSQSASPENEVRTSVAAFARAFQEADVSVLETILTENYIHVNGGSGNRLDRDQWLTWIASRRLEIESGDFVYETYLVEDLQVQLYGDSAVVVGVTRSNGQRNGVPFTNAGNFTNIWVRQNGVWRRAGFHDSPLPESGS
jgi:ketosteroid isomerase-like protein